MKYLFTLSILLFFTTGLKNVSETIALKTFAEEAMNKSLIDKDPTIVITQVSAKIYSKIDLRHPVFNKLNRDDLFIIPKNSDVIEEFWGKRGKENGAIVYKAAQEFKPEIKKMRYVLNGKEIKKEIADTLNMKNVKGFVCLKNTKTQQCVAFINTIE